jgi:hypothetical protein
MYKINKKITQKIQYKKRLNTILLLKKKDLILKKRDKKRS